VSGVPLVLGSAAALCALAAVRRGSRSRSYYAGPKPEGTAETWDQRRELSVSTVDRIRLRYGAMPVEIEIELLHAGSVLYHGTVNDARFQQSWPATVGPPAIWLSNDPVVSEWIALGRFDDDEGRVITFVTTRDLALARIEGGFGIGESPELAAITNGAVRKVPDARDQLESVCQDLAAIGVDGWRNEGFYGYYGLCPYGDNGDDILICAKDALKVQRVRAVPKPWYRRPW